MAMEETAGGTVFQIQRWSVHDGAGIRSTVFLKGCPLRCRWCANAESWRPEPEMLYFADRCRACGQCSAACPSGAAVRRPDGIAFNRESCVACGRCAAVCPAGARQRLGEAATAESVLRTVLRDAVFYRASGGGVTFSGGEPFFQADFLRALTAACVRRGLDIAVETSGYFDWAANRDLVERFDGVFVDIKHMDDARHRYWTGVGNEVILGNVARIAAVCPAVIRVPLVAGVNDAPADIRRLCEFLARLKARPAGVEFLPYHDYGSGKRRALGLPQPAFQAPDAARIGELKQIAAGYGLTAADFK